MDKKRVDYYKKKLDAKRDELQRLMAADDATQDIADKAANSYTKEFLFSQSNNERYILALVEDALGRMKNGGFGECVACHEEVQQKRLDAVPWARHCIACQQKQED